MRIMKSAKLFSRRQMLQGAVTSIVITTIPVRGQAQTKFTKSEASYRNSPHNGQHCSICTFFEKPHSCRLVSGTINPSGWCKFFSAAG
jgi:hypothetical protein